MLFFLLISSRSPQLDLSNITVELPRSYDFLADHPECDFGPLSQECGCCYAYGPLKAVSHRFCKRTGVMHVLSAQNIVACDVGDNACTGGCERTVFYYLEQYGVTNTSCHPWRGMRKYEKEFCSVCVDGSTPVYFKVKYGSVHHYVGVENIKKAIFLDGPVSASIASDTGFSAYRGGLYTSSHKKRPEAGNHSVEIIGWGVDESGTEYWIILNQYGTSWGENGRMRIKMHSDEGLIESFIYGAEPDV